MRPRFSTPCGGVRRQVAGSVLLLLVLLEGGDAHGAPDEELLGRSAGYPPARTIAQSMQERYRVGSFSAMDSIAPHCDLQPAADPLPLKRSAADTPFSYRFDGQALMLEDYLQRQRTTALLVLKDGAIVAEHYNYDRKPSMRMVSNSMAKTLVALAAGKALEEGLIRSFEDKAATYAPELAGSLYGETRISSLLRMASGSKFFEDYSGADDLSRFNQIMRTQGLVAAVRGVSERAAPEGAHFSYAGADTYALSLVVRGATGRSLCEYVAEKIWQPMGAESRATWLVNPADGAEFAAGAFSATVRDYARLGWMMANDGVVRGRSVVAREHLLSMTMSSRQPENFRPGRMTYKGSTYMGYGMQTWLMPGSHRRFALLGIYGQAIYVDPDLQLVMVHMAVAKAAAGDVVMGPERDALWRGVVAHYGRW